MTLNESAGGGPLDHDWTDRTRTVQRPTYQRTWLVEAAEVILSVKKTRHPKRPNDNYVPIRIELVRNP